jgi:hypothetical protein
MARRLNGAGRDSPRTRLIHRGDLCNLLLYLLRPNLTKDHSQHLGRGTKLKSGPFLNGLQFGPEDLDGTFLAVSRLAHALNDLRFALWEDVTDVTRYALKKRQYLSLSRMPIGLLPFLFAGA